FESGDGLSIRIGYRRRQIYRWHGAAFAGLLPGKAGTRARDRVPAVFCERMACTRYHNVGPETFDRYGIFQPAVDVGERFLRDQKDREAIRKAQRDSRYGGFLWRPHPGILSVVFQKAAMNAKIIAKPLAGKVTHVDPIAMLSPNVYAFTWA